MTGEEAEMHCNLTRRQRWQYVAVGVGVVAVALAMHDRGWLRVLLVGLGLVVALEGAAGY